MPLIQRKSSNPKHLTNCRPNGNQPSHMSPNSEGPFDHRNDMTKLTQLNIKINRKIGTDSQANTHHGPTVFNAKSAPTTSKFQQLNALRHNPSSCNYHQPFIISKRPEKRNKIQIESHTGDLRKQQGQN